jgi:DNA-binding NarL/FixJ family response regulator
MIESPERARLPIDDHRLTGQRVNQPEVHTGRFLGPMTKVPYNLRGLGDFRESGYTSCQRWVYILPIGSLFMKALIVDDHALIREALHVVMKQLKREAVIFEASNSFQAMQLVEEHPDISLVLLDINLPDRDGFALLRELRDGYATIAIIILSSSNDPDTVKRAFKLGALGFIPKTTELEVMLNAIQLVLSGGIYVPSEILGSEETTSRRPTNKVATCDSLKDLGLTDRQTEVLALLMQGKSNKAIAKILNMAVPTVKNHITVVLKVLNVTSRTEAVIKVGEMGCDLSPKSQS